MIRLVIDSRLPEIGRAMDLVDAFRDSQRLAEADANALCVVLDEILSNTIRHGLGGKAGHEISILLDRVDVEVVVEVEDDGPPFDPTAAEAAVPTGRLEERKAGGIGLLFVRQLTHAMEYRRVEGHNRITLRRRVQGA
jgi:anti-sigma regulatory factor (Ser/Thr protein kinase)